MYSVDVSPDPLILDVWQSQRRYVKFIAQDVWSFVPAPVRARRRRGAGAVAVADEPAVAAPGDPVSRDPAVSLRRSRDLPRRATTRRRTSSNLVTIYRGVLLYGDLGRRQVLAGQRGPAARPRCAAASTAERVRVQPRPGEEIVVERIATTEDDAARTLPSLLSADGETSARIVHVGRRTSSSVSARRAPTDAPLLIFDQFEEIVTLFEDARRRATCSVASSTCSSALLRGARCRSSCCSSFARTTSARSSTLLAAVPGARRPGAATWRRCRRRRCRRSSAVPSSAIPGHFERELRSPSSSTARVRGPRCSVRAAAS